MQNIWGNLIPQVNTVNNNEKFDKEFNEYVNKQLQINNKIESESDSIEDVQTIDEVPVSISEESVEKTNEIPIVATAKKKKSKKHEIVSDIE